MKRISGRFSMVRTCVSVFLCLIVIFQCMFSVQGVTRELAAIEINGRTLTASLYDEDLEQNTQIMLIETFADWRIYFSDGKNRYCTCVTFLSRETGFATVESALAAIGHYEILDNGIYGYNFPVHTSYTIRVINHRLIWSVTIPDSYDIDKNNLEIEAYQIHHNDHFVTFGDFWGSGSGSGLDSFFTNYFDKPKYTKKANKWKPENDKQSFVDALLQNDLGTIKGTKKEKEIRKKIYNLMFTAKYRPTAFGATKSDIQSWPFQNVGPSGTSVFDSGLNQTVTWAKPGKGCCAYARFASQYVNGSNGAYSKNSLVYIDEPAEDADDIKDLIMEYADPGESIHYLYSNTEHWVVYVGCDDTGFYFLSYEGGRWENKEKGTSGDWPLLDLEYVTYEKIAKTCKNKQFEIWDTNGGCYKDGGVQTSSATVTGVKVSISKFGKINVEISYGNGQTGYLNSSKSAITTDADDSYEIMLKGNEYNTISITADGQGTIDCDIDYIMSDGSQNSRSFKHVPIDQNKTISSRINSGFDQGNLTVEDKSGEIVYWSCGINETATEPEPEHIYYDPSLEEYDDSSSYSTVSIHNFVSSKTVDYQATVTFGADVQNGVDGGQIHWFIDGQDQGTGDSFTVNKAKKSYTVQAMYIKDGRILAVSELETVNVKTGFFAKLKAFFRALFGRLPKQVQELYDIDFYFNLLP